MVFRDSQGIDIAHACSVDVAVALMWELDWTIYGSATQPDGWFLAVSPCYEPDEFTLDAGLLGWMEMTVEDLEELDAE